MRPRRPFLSTALAAAASLSLGGSLAQAADLGPSAQFALATLLARYSPLLDPEQKQVVAQLATGQNAGANAIVITASEIKCRASNVDLTSRGCTIRYDKQNVQLAGLEANELLATMLEAGVPPDPAAGTTYVGVSHLECTLVPSTLAARDGRGRGIQCSFDPNG